MNATIGASVITAIAALATAGQDSGIYRLACAALPDCQAAKATVAQEPSPSQSPMASPGAMPSPGHPGQDPSVGPTSTLFPQPGGGDPPLSRRPPTPARSAGTDPAGHPVTAPTTPNRTCFAPSVAEQTVVTMDSHAAQESITIDYWRRTQDTTGDLHAEPGALTTNLGAQLTVVARSPDADTDPDAWYGGCRKLGPWQINIPYSSLKVGDQLCALSYTGRYAVMKIRSVPSASDPRLIFYGRVWNPAG